MKSGVLDDRKQREREFHNEVFSDHRRQAVAKYYSVTKQSQAHFSQLVTERASNKRVLEYGCGEGSMAFVLPQAASVTGIDISDVAISRLAARAGHNGTIRFLVMDAENLAFPDGSFDVVCGSGILHHLNLDRSYSEIARVLSPEGCAIFSEPLGHNPAINLYRRFTPSMRTPDEHPLLVGDLRRAQRYFGTVETRFFHLLSLGAVPIRRTKLFDAVLKALDAADSLLFASLPWSRRFAWMAVMMLANPRRPTPSE